MKVNPLSTLVGKNSSSAAWIEWHKALKRNFGERTANATWVKAWEKRGSKEANNNALRDYMKKYDVIIKPDNILESVGDQVGSVLGYIGDIFKIGITGAGIMTGIVFLAGVAIIYQAFKKDGGKGLAQTALMVRGVK